MKHFFRILHWRARARYWRKKFEQAEAQIAELSARADAEMWRNREREDTFVSAAILGGRGMFGIAPRTGPAAKPQPKVPSLPTEPWQALTPIQRMEFETQYLPDALRNNVPEHVARAKFLSDMAQRGSFNDEPFS